MLFEQVECFLAVAKAGSVSRAAETMFLAQPSLTARLRALEDEVGDQLFVRTRSGMRLTEAGRGFLPYAERCVVSIENGKRHLKELREAPSGQLKIGALPRVSTYTLPTLIDEFTSANPRATVSVRTGHSEDVLGMVVREEVHLGLARAIDHPDVENRPLYEEKLVLVVGARHRFAREGHAELIEVAQERLILFDRASSNYELTKSLFREASVREPNTMELDNIEAAKKMVECGLGVAFLPEHSVFRALEVGRLRRVGVEGIPNLKRCVAVLRHRETAPTGAVSAFLDLAGRMGRALNPC